MHEPAARNAALWEFEDPGMPVKLARRLQSVAGWGPGGAYGLRARDHAAKLWFSRHKEEKVKLAGLGNQ